MSIKSDEPFEIPGFLRNPSGRGGRVRLPRATDLWLKPQGGAPESSPDGSTSPDFDALPERPLNVPLRRARVSTVVLPLVAFAAALVVGVAVVRLPAFESLVTGASPKTPAASPSLAAEPAAASALQDALSAQAATTGPAPSPAPWSLKAAQLQRETPAESAAAPAAEAVAPAVVAAEPAAPVAAETSAAAETPLSVAAAAAVAAPPLAPAAAAPQTNLGDMVADATPAPAGAEGAVHGVSDKEIRFGMVSPFTGANKESGRQLKLGVDVAFAQANEAGGVNGRQLKLIAVDDGYEPTRTLAAMQELFEKDDVFGFLCNFGTATAAVSVPYALDHKTVYMGALTGAGLLRRDPPDRYVFNYRPSYAEETGAALRYLVKVRRISPREIAVFTQMDGFGDAGYDGVSKALRALADAPDKIMRIGYKRNSIDVQDAVTQLRATRGRIKAVIMVATYRAAAKFIEKTREVMPDLIYTNVSAVGSTSLADELMLLGPRYAEGVVVTQVTPAVSSSASFVLKYKAALARYFPGEAPDYTSLESYIDADIMIEALKRSGRQVDTEKLVDTMESMRDLDFGLGTILRYSANEHQGSHKVWGTELDANGKYQPIDLE